jgi:hypothetical protein
LFSVFFQLKDRHRNCFAAQFIVNVLLMVLNDLLLGVKQECCLRHKLIPRPALYEVLPFIHIFYNLIKKHSICQKEIPHSSSFIGFIRNDKSFLMEGEEVESGTIVKKLPGAILGRSQRAGVAKGGEYMKTNSYPACRKNL